MMLVVNSAEKCYTVNIDNGSIDNDIANKYYTASIDDGGGK